jgi:hypothetical protein
MARKEVGGSGRKWEEVGGSGRKWEEVGGSGRDIYILYV